MNHTDTIVTSADKVFSSMRKMIVEGELEAGTKLSEAELSANFSVSRAVVREAINRLVSINIVERKANVGAKVVTLTLQGLIELYEIRESLEGMAARLAAANMSDEEISDLKALLTSHSEKVAEGDRYYQEAGDVDFHYRIVKGSHNLHLFNLLTNSIYHLVRMYRVQLGMAGPRVSTAYAEHKQIVQAIANRDQELAEMLMRRHILYSRNNIQRKLEEKQ